MNTPIRRVSMVVILMMVALLANATYVQVVKADSLRNDPRNSRVLLDEYSRQRGAITAGGQVIAASVPTDSRLKFLRDYPKQTAAAFAPVSGFFSFQYGSTELEKAENSILSGDDDRLFGQRFMDTFSGRDPRGGNVVTTIDPRAQRAAYDQMSKGCNGGCRGAVVAMEPNTGKILAMVSTPSFDPNKLASHDENTREQAWNQWNQPDGSQPMLNRATEALYPPGSTYKVVTTAAALRDGVSPDVRLTSSPSFPLPDTNITLPNYDSETCPEGSGGTVSLTTALKYSCNAAFADLVVNHMPKAQSSFADASHQFGMDDPAPDIPMSPAKPTIGDIPDKASLAQSSIGQRNVKLTPLENAMIAATVANGGVRMQPYLVDKLQSADLRTLHTTRPTTINQPITSDQAATLTDMMVQSEKATAGSGGPMMIASKTGTAEQGTSTATPLSWYIAFGPSSDAKVAVAVVVENGGYGVNSVGGTVAAPIGRAVINAVAGGGR